MADGFIWYELMTTDPQAARAFYRAVVGWEIEAEPAGEMDYRMIVRSDGGHAGGVLRLTDAMRDGGARPGWLGYLYTADVDALVAATVADGGSVHMPAVDMPVGRMAMIADPQGATFYAMTPVPPEGRPDAQSDVFSVDRPQHVRWNELQSTDPAASVAFYTGHFGWTQEGAMPMGDLGDYMFIQQDGVGIGAIMRKLPHVPASAWGFYIGVDDIDRAVTAVGPAGGKLLGPVEQIPGGEFTVHAADPQGAAFGLVGPRG
ncbi:VOC family protein [Novosphingobium sp. ZN18A2]|uniref:VOC family protein n=1 Tax=Novosphingobium sp. ZN18A2 TaxID=3079861 RepID=UPI0030D2832B